MIRVFMGGQHIALDNVDSEVYRSEKNLSKKVRTHPSTFKLRDVVRIEVPAFMSVGQKKILKQMLKHT